MLCSVFGSCVIVCVCFGVSLCVCPACVFEFACLRAYLPACALACLFASVRVVVRLCVYVLV